MTTVAPPRRPDRSPAPAPTPSGPRRWLPAPWRRAEARAAPRDDLPTLCLFLVTLAVALSLGRLFRGTTWLPYGIAAAALGHLMAGGLRRLGAGLTVASLASALLSILVAIELVVPQATTFGVPTPFTFDVLGQALTDAQSSFRTAVPPVAPATGFLAAAVVGVCMCAFLADWAAFRMRTAFEACVPALALFVFTAVLGAKSHRGLAVAGFAAAVLVFLIVQRANLDGGQTAWFGGRDRGALPSLLGTGAILGVVAVLGALVLTPLLPGATSKALLSFKKGAGGSGTGTRSTVSPLVDIQTRLREYADVEVFKVRAERPAYWRLTSLDQFDGTIWSSNERYASNRGQLSQSSGPAGTRLQQEVTVSGLASIWLPAAYRPAAVQGVDGLSYSPGSGSLITRKDTSDGLTYRITSVLPDVTAELLQRAPASGAGRSELGADFARYTKVGGAVSPRVQQLAQRLGRAPTPFAKALAIQEHLRSAPFTYNLSVRAGHSENAIDRFLFVTQQGYCEQFAGSYAVLARLMGLPTRVAVGFQPGVAQDGTFTVKDKDAHAWPEVYFEGIGWMAFEPTPSGAAGNPQSAQYTGVPYKPAAPSPGQATTSPTTAAPAPTAPSDATTAPRPGEQDAPAVDPQAAPGRGWWTAVLDALRKAAPLWLALAALAALAGASSAFVAWERRGRRRRAGGSPEARVHMAWQESLDALALAGVRPRPAETVAELVHRLRSPAGGAALAGVERGTPANEALVRLGDAVVATAYAGRPAGPSMADAAEDDRSIVVVTCRRALSRWARLGADIDPRPAVARLQAARAARHPRLPSEALDR